MQTLQEIKRRIGNAQDLHALVRTMKTIAAVNVRHYERSVESLADYNRATEMGLQVVLRERAPALTADRARVKQAVGVIVFGSDQGMCGQFNEQIAAYTMAGLGEMAIPAEDRVMVAVGGRAAARLEDAGQPVSRQLDSPGSLPGITPIVQEALWVIEQWQDEGSVSRVLLFYNRLLSGSTFEPRTVHLWPIPIEDFSHLEREAWPSRVLPTYTMEWEALFRSLLRQHLFVSLFRAGSESLASENASRLMSMQVAERNIEEKMGELDALYHQQRQNGITGELLDIISGFEVLTGS